LKFEEKCKMIIHLHVHISYIYIYSIIYIYITLYTYNTHTQNCVHVLYILYITHFSLNYKTYIKLCTMMNTYIYRVRHQNPDKSNNFSKRNFINEKIEYYKKFFYISRSESLQSIIIQYIPHQLQSRPLFSI